jgi:ABC-type multidrug transport system permease subunit
MFVSYRYRLVATILNTIFGLTLFYYLSRLVRVTPFHKADSYFAYAVVGLVILQVLNATIGGSPGALRGESVAGTFERILVSPFGPERTLMATLIFPVFLAMVTGLVMLLLGSTVFGLDVRWETAGLAIPVGALGALAFAPFAVILLAGTVMLKQTASGATWVVALIALVSGLYFPVSLLPAAIRWATDVQPFTPAADLMRNLMVGAPYHGSAWGHLARLAAFAAVLLPPTLVLLRLALDHGRRRGTILEY